jgi:hypothetical protein
MVAGAGVSDANAVDKSASRMLVVSTNEILIISLLYSVTYH